MLLNICSGVFRQVLADLGYNFAVYVNVKRRAQIRQSTGWCHDDNCFDLFCTNQLFQCGRYLVSEAMLFYLVPVGRRYTAASICCRTFEGAAWAVSALLVSWRIVVHEYTFNNQIGKLLIAVVPQEQRFMPIANEDDRIVWQALSSPTQASFCCHFFTNSSWSKRTSLACMKHSPIKI